MALASPKWSPQNDISIYYRDWVTFMDRELFSQKTYTILICDPKNNFT